MSLSFTGENILHANVVSFAVMVAIITFACIKFKVGNIFENQRQKIKQVVDLSENARQESIDKLKDVKQELSVLPNKLMKLEEEAKQTAKTLVENIEKDTELKKQILQNNAETSYDYHCKNAKQKLSQQVSVASVNLAKDNFNTMINNNPDIHYKILSECIEKL